MSGSTERNAFTSFNRTGFTPEKRSRQLRAFGRATSRNLWIVMRDVARQYLALACEMWSHPAAVLAAFPEHHGRSSHDNAFWK